MKLHILDQTKAKKGELELPSQFSEPLREDLIQRAVYSLQAAARQPYGTHPMAGMRVSAKLSRRRRDYRGSYGKGISRVPRKIMTRRGSQMHMVGALAPGTVGGRRAHPPKASKVWEQKINKTENRKAIRSALAAVMDAALVQKRGHKIPAEYPFLLDDSFESMQKTKEVVRALLALGFERELARSERTHVRAGKAKLRGRKTKRPTGLLLVVGDAEAKLLRGAANIPGVTIAPVTSLNALLLAPGTHPGRATLFTQRAIKLMKEQNLFLDNDGSEKQKIVGKRNERKTNELPNVIKSDGTKKERANVTTKKEFAAKKPVTKSE